MTHFTFLRRQARHVLVQALYQWQINESPFEEIAAQFLADQERKIDKTYFQSTLKEVISHCTQLDNLFLPYLDRDIAHLTPIELAILRLGTYELQFRLDIPYRVVLNEALELAKRFGATDSHKYVNAILDKLSSVLRPDEKKA